jgi:uncharacterized protein (TIGR03435 family)
MRTATLTVLSIAFATATVRTQAPPPSAAAGPTFEVVSIKRNTSGALGSNGSSERPDGSFTLLNVPVITLIARAYTIGVPADYVGRPDWSGSERYDVVAKSSLTNPTREQRAAMMKAMLADRFKLLVHVENREQQVYDLIVARRDGRLGLNIKPSESDCEAQDAAAQAARAAGTPPPRPASPDLRDPNWIAPPCTRWTIGDRMQGDYTMAILAANLRPTTGDRRPVIDKTGLNGSWRVTLTYDTRAAFRGPATAPPPDAAPSVFTAVQEQLGLKLEPARVSQETLVIDRLERPTEN